MHFRLSYITKDFHFGAAIIQVADPDKAIKVVYQQRPNDGEPPQLESGDGLIVATCERVLSQRLTNEAASSGTLSCKKQAVGKVFEEMQDCVQRSLRIVRWRTNAVGGPNPIRTATRNYFSWSTNGLDWRIVTDCGSATLRIRQINRIWTKDDGEFLQRAIANGENEPLGHELLREARINQLSNPRSSLILAVAAAEVGFKQFASKTFSDAAWLLGLSSPPLIDMLNKFPWEQLKLEVTGNIQAVLDALTEELKKAVNLRNSAVHTGAAKLKFETLDSILGAVSDFLYFLDMLSGIGQTWPANFIRPDTISQFKKE